MELSAPIAAGDHEVRVLEHSQVLHDAKASHLRQRRLELAQRLTVPLPQTIEQPAPMRIGESPEDRLQSFHRVDYM